ncbi:MAG: DUF4783 domain-containing protein [Planctomycetes bacterium]|nr:DUF4783 domain-containing protein [Planctomycetota bacterium]
MKRLTPLTLIILAIPVAADDEEIDDAAKAVFESFEGAWKDGSVGGIAAHFDRSKDAKVSLSLHKSGSFSADQARGVLKEYFDDYTVVSLDLPKDGYEAKPSPHVSYAYAWTDPAGRKQTGKLYVALAKVGEKWVISQIRVMK